MSTYASVSYMSDSVPLQRLELNDSIVTGAAVSLDISPASPLSRVLAGVIDMFVYSAATFLIALGGVAILPAPSESIMRVYIIMLFALPLLTLPLSVEVLSRGRSLGKWALRLQVVRDDGGPLSFRHSLTRVLVGIFEVWMSYGAVATLSSIFHPRGKRLGDMAAGTMLVQQPEGQLFPALLMPPDAYDWSQQVHLLPLPSALVQRATMFIRNAVSLSPMIRQQTAQALLEDMAPFVEPAPPEHLHPERVIVALLVLNRNRDMRRQLRWDGKRRRSVEQSQQAFFDL